MQRPTLAAGVLLVIVLIGFGAADYWFKEHPTLEYAQEIPSPIPLEPTTQSSSSVSSDSSASSVSLIPLSSASSSSGLRVIKKGTSTKKQIGVNVDEVIMRLGLTKQETTETGFLALATQYSAKAQTTVLLWNDDRAFLFSWIENDDVKTIFGNLKQALQEQFSGKLTDLKDETLTAPNGPTVNVLSFFDPALSAERLIFLRVRTRLYEIHVAKNGESLVDRFVAELSK